MRMLKAVCLAAAVAISLAGCAGGSDIIGARLDALDARKLDLATSDGRISAIDQLAPLTDNNTIAGGDNKNQRILEYINDNAPLASHIYEDLLARTARCKSINCAISSVEMSRVLQSAKMISDDQASDIFRAADLSVAESILSDRHSVVLGAKGLNDFQSTKRPDVERKLAINLFDALPGFGGENQRKNQKLLSDYISNLPDRVNFLKELESRLKDKTSIKAADLDDAYGFLFPSQVAMMVSGRRKFIALTSNPPRRLVEEDVKAALELDRDVKIVPPGTAGAILIEIRELEVREREMPPSRRTEIIASVDILTAALLLPQNATVMVDVIEGSADVEFAYEIEIRKPKEKPVLKLIRDRISQSSRSCENLRYQNVFGGVGPLGVWPNSQIQSYCGSGSGSASVSSIRGGIPDILADSIKPLL